MQIIFVMNNFNNIKLLNVMAKQFKNSKEYSNVYKTYLMKQLGTKYY